MSERRKQHRIPVERMMAARLFVEGRETMAQVIDLNNAGAFVATELAVDKNTALQIELCLPGEDKSLPLKAVVARRTELIEGKRTVIPAGLGLVFMAENVMERAFIQKAVLEVLKGSLESTRMNLEQQRLSGDGPAYP